MIYYLFGKDDFRKRLRVEELKNNYLKNGYQILKFEEEETPTSPTEKSCMYILTIHHSFFVLFDF